MDNITPIERAVRAAGSQQALADALGIRAPSVHEWRKNNRVPAERVLAVEAISGVSRHELRPDIYGPAPGDDALAEVA